MRNSTSFSLDSEDDQYSALRIGVGGRRGARLENRIASFTLGSHSEILSNGKPILPVEIHLLTALLGAATWYTSAGEKRGAFPSEQILASIAECAFAGGNAFGALHMSTMKLALENCKIAGAGDAILGGLLAIVKPCWESVQNSIARAALGLIPSNLIRVCPNQSDLQNFVDGKSTGLLLPLGRPGCRMLRSLAGLMNISMKLTRVSHRNDKLVVEDLIYSCNRAVKSRNRKVIVATMPANPTPLGMVVPLIDDASTLDETSPSLDETRDEDTSFNDKDASSRSSSDLDDDSMPTEQSAGAPDPGIPNVANELMLSTAVSSMVKCKRSNIGEDEASQSAIRNILCTYRWIISTSSAKVNSKNEENGVQLLRVPKGGHTHNTTDFASKSHLPLPISLRTAFISSLGKGSPLSRSGAKAHLHEVGLLEPQILMKELLSFGTFESERKSTLVGATVSAKSIDQHEHGRSWTIKRKDPPHASSSTATLPIGHDAFGPHPFVCFCSMNRLDISSDMLSCGAAGCRYGGLFHYECLQSKMPDLVLSEVINNPFFRCLSCIEEGNMVPNAAAVVSALQQLQEEDDEENSVSSNLPSKNSAKDSAAALGIPSVFTAHRFSITKTEYYNLQSTIRRALVL